MAAGLAGLAACPFAGATPAATGGPPVLPLDAAQTGSQGTWVVMAMGRLGTRNNTFWQLFAQAAGAQRWTLATPPGVATNGGLVVGVGAPTLTVGFEPSELLRYSPLAQSTDSGKTWTGGVMPDALEAVPGALAAEPGGAVLGLTRHAGGTVTRSPGSLEGWKTLAALGSLSRSSSSQDCRPTGLSAVTAGGGTSVLVGAVCSRPGAVGLYSLSGSTWAPDGPQLAPSTARRTASVLRLESGAAGTSALIELRRGKSGSVIAAWQAAGSGTWTVSAPFALRGSLQATAAAATGSFVVTASGRAGFSAATVVAPTAASGTAAAATTAPGQATWQPLPSPPPHTAVVVDIDGTAVALSAHSSRFRSFSDSGGVWVLHTSVTVPIQYGSST